MLFFVLSVVVKVSFYQKSIDIISFLLV